MHDSFLKCAVSGQGNKATESLKRAPSWMENQQASLY